MHENHLAYSNKQTKNQDFKRRMEGPNHIGNNQLKTDQVFLHLFQHFSVPPNLSQLSVYVDTCMPPHKYGGQRKFIESVLSFCIYLGSRDQTQVFRLSGSHDKHFTIQPSCQPLNERTFVLLYERKILFVSLYLTYDFTYISRTYILYIFLKVKMYMAYLEICK